MRGGAASAGPSDSRLDHVLRDIKDRLRRLENRRPAAYALQGGWSITTNASGDLIAVNKKSGATVVLAVA